MATFFEVHYYDNGLKTDLLPAGARPAILPARQGLDSSEIELKQGDFAVEVANFGRDGHQVVWIAVHTYGVDRQHGSRGNSWGVGIWLIDEVPLYVDLLLDFLNGAVAQVAKNRGPNRETHTSLDQFARGFSENHWCTPTASLPNDIWASRFNTDGGGTSSYVAIQSQTLDFALIGTDILHRFLAKPDEDDTAPRRLYMLARNSKVVRQNLRELSYASLLQAEERTIADFIHETAGPAREQNTAIASLRQQLEERQRTISNLNGQIEAQRQSADDLRTQLAEEESRRRAEMQSVFEVVSQYATGVPSGAPFSASDAPSNSRVLNEIHEIVRKNKVAIDDIRTAVKSRKIARIEASGIGSELPSRSDEGSAYRNLSRSWLSRLNRPVVYGPVAIVAAFVIAFMVERNLMDRNDTAPAATTTSATTPDNGSPGSTLAPWEEKTSP